MRKTTVLTLWVASLALVANAFGQGNGNKPDPAEALQGKWAVASLGVAGYELKGTPEQPMTVTITKNRMVTRPAYVVGYSVSVSFGGGGLKRDRTTTISLSERDQEATFRLDPGKTPGQIDLEERDGKNVRVRKGIYRMTADHLELCIGDSKRPGEFKATTSEVLLRLKRVGK